MGIAASIYCPCMEVLIVEKFKKYSKLLPSCFIFTMSWYRELNSKDMICYIHYTLTPCYCNVLNILQLESNSLWTVLLLVLLLVSAGSEIMETSGTVVVVVAGSGPGRQKFTHIFRNSHQKLLYFLLCYYCLHIYFMECLGFCVRLSFLFLGPNITLCGASIRPVEGRLVL